MTESTERSFDSAFRGGIECRRACVGEVELGGEREVGEVERGGVKAGGRLSAHSAVSER